MLKTAGPQLLCWYVALVSSQSFLYFEILSLLSLPHFASLYVVIVYVFFVCMSVHLSLYCHLCQIVTSIPNLPKQKLVWFFFFILHCSHCQRYIYTTVIVFFVLSVCCLQLLEFLETVCVEFKYPFYSTSIMVWHCKWNGLCKSGG